MKEKDIGAHNTECEKIMPYAISRQLVPLKMMRVKVAGIDLARFHIDCAVDFITTEEYVKIYC